MRESKFQLGQTVYTVEDYRIGRFVILEVINKVSKDGESVEYCLVNDINRQVVYNEVLVVGTIEEAKETAKKNWEVIAKRTTEALEMISDEFFNDRRKQYEEKMKGQKVA